MKGRTNKNLYLVAVSFPLLSVIFTGPASPTIRGRGGVFSFAARNVARLSNLPAFGVPFARVTLLVVVAVGLFGPGGPGSILLTPLPVFSLSGGEGITLGKVRPEVACRARRSGEVSVKVSCEYFTGLGMFVG